jgi:uroporphyrinogen-III synthase
MNGQALDRWPVVVTRDEPSDGPLSSALRAQGLTVLSWPLLKVLPATDPAVLAAALRTATKSTGQMTGCEAGASVYVRESLKSQTGLMEEGASGAAGRAFAGATDGFDWIVFTSRHAVTAVTALQPAPPAGVRVAAVGESTAQALRDAGWTVDQVPAQHHAQGLVAALAPRLRPGMRVLHPASSRALPTLAQGLAALGVEVVRVEAYRTEAAAPDVAPYRALIERNAVGAVTFTSPSAVEELDRALGPKAFKHLLSSAFAVALGATTGSALAERDFPCVLATPATLAGLAGTTSRLIRLKL